MDRGMTRENMPSFFDLQLMLLVEESHASASTSTHVDNKMLFMEEDRPRGRVGRGGSTRNGDAVDKSKTEGTEALSTTVLEPLETARVKAAPKTSKEIPRQNVGIVARKATEKASVGRSTDSDKSGSGSGRTKQGNLQRLHYTKGS